MKKVTTVLPAFILCACTTVPQAMSGKIGCTADEILVLETDPGFGITNTDWKAQCGQRQYICTLGPRAEDLNDMSCAQLHTLTTPLEEDLGTGQIGRDFEKFVSDPHHRGNSETACAENPENRRTK